MIKENISIVLIALVGACYNFIAVQIDFYRKDYDGCISAKSNLRKALENNTINVADGISLLGTNEKLSYIIVGDEAFPFNLIY